MTKCILFDADGVLIHSEMFSIQYQRKFNVPDKDMLPFFTGRFQDCMVGKADLIEIVRPWLEKWKWTGTVDEFLTFWFESEHNVDERLVKLIQELRKNKIKCYLATNQEKYRTQYMKDRMGFEGLFNHVFSSSDIGHKKDEKEFFTFVLNELKNEHGIFPHDVMFFDDCEKHIEIAKSLDINAHLYTDIDNFTHIIQKEFPQVLKNTKTQ